MGVRGGRVCEQVVASFRSNKGMKSVCVMGEYECILRC